MATLRSAIKCLSLILINATRGVFLFPFIVIKLPPLRLSAFIPPLAVRFACSVPFLHFLRFFLLAPLTLHHSLRRKLCNSSHVFFMAVPVGLLGCGCAAD